MIFLSCTKHSDMRFAKALDEAERLVWQDADSCLRVLGRMPLDEMSEKESMRWQLVSESAALRKHQYTQLCDKGSQTDSVIQNVVAYYRKSEDKANLCKSLYVLGMIQYALQGDIISCTRTLKEAEYYIPYLEAGSQYAGMILLSLAHTASDEQLYSVMQSYALQAVPYFKQDDDHLHLCACYRDAGFAGLYGDVDLETVSQYLDSAIAEADMAQDKVMMYDILFHREQCDERPDTAKLLYYCKQLCDTSGIRQYAGEIAGIYIQQGNISEAEKYLHILSADTLSSRWCKEQYLYQHSRLLRLKGQSDAAYRELSRMYGSRVEQLTTESRSRAYTVSRLYDIEHEQNKVLRLEVKTRRLRGIVAGSIGVILIVVLFCGLIYSHIRQKSVRQSLQARMQHEMDEQEKKHLQYKNETLKREVEEKRSALRQYLHTRLVLTQAMARYTDSRDSDIPQTVARELHKLTVLSESDWKRFSKDYNNASNGFLERKQKEHPRLSERDLRYLALYSMGFDNIDICSLLDISKASGWNIKSTILHRLSQNDKEIEDIMNSKPQHSRHEKAVVRGIGLPR